MSQEILNTENNEVANTTTQAPTKTRKPRAKKVTKKVTKTVVENLEDVQDVAPKERAPRVPKIDKVQAEICKQFEITDVQFWKFMATHKPKKMNNNKFADSLIERAFFNREKLAEQLKG